MSDEVLDLLAKEEYNAQQIDQYKMVAVVDAGRSFANNEVSHHYSILLITNICFSVST